MSQIKIEYSGLTDIGHVRKVNEDSLGYVESVYGPIFTVCDGMGGHVGGATASGLAVKSILEFIATSTVENPSVTINNAIISANEKIVAMAKANPDLKGMGTTATVLVIQPEGAYLAHLGDSRIYIFSDGRLHRLTKDHSFVQTLVDAGAISDEEAESHPRKNELMKALGVSESVQPTIINAPVKPKQGDIFLLCSDGLCGLLTDTGMATIISEHVGLATAAEQLITAAKNAGGHDNITVQLVKIIESPYSISSFASFSPNQKQNPQVTTNIPQASQSLAKETWPKTSPKQRPPLPAIIIPVIAILLLTGITYFMKTWPFNAASPVSNNVQASSVLNKNGLLPGDRIYKNYLIHSVGKEENNLDSIIAARKIISGSTYKEFDYGKTFSNDDMPVDKNNFSKLNEIKWKKFSLPAGVQPSNTGITITDDSIKIAENKARLKEAERLAALQKKADGNKTDGHTAGTSNTGRHKDLANFSKQLEKLKIEQGKCLNKIKGVERNIETAKERIKIANDSTLYASDKVKKNQAKEEARQATLILNKAEGEKKRYDNEYKIIVDKIKKLTAAN